MAGQAMRPDESTIKKLFDALGIEPQAMTRSAAGERKNWYPAKSFVSPMRPGAHFDRRTGKLLLFQERQVAVIRGGDPMAWRKTEEKPWWEGFRVRPLSLRRKTPDHRLQAALAGGDTAVKQLSGREKGDLAWYQFRQTFPASVAGLAMRTHSDSAWGVLEILCRVQGSTDVFQSNPAVCIIAAHHFIFAPQKRTTHPFRVTRRLLRGKQSAILEHGGFEPGDRKILARVASCDASLVLLLTLRKILRENAEARKVLRHMDRQVSRDIVFLLREPCGQYVTAPLLNEVGARKRRGCPTATIQDIHEMRTLLGLQGTVRFNSLSAVHTAHENLVDRVNSARTGQDYSRIVFPAAPFPAAQFATPDGDLRIDPIDDPRMLVDHGRKQRNCCACYCQSVETGKFFIYRAEPVIGEPHTLAIRPNRTTGVWQLSEIEAPANRRPDPNVRQAVLEWLARAQQLQVESVEASEIEGVDEFMDADAHGVDAFDGLGPI